jgi:hypothetical protein
LVKDFRLFWSFAFHLHIPFDPFDFVVFD